MKGHFGTRKLIGAIICVYRPLNTRPDSLIDFGFLALYKFCT